MSEYVSKKALLEWLKEQQKQQEEKRDRLEIDHPYWEYHEGASDYLSLSVEKIQSGAFDADDLIGDRIDEKCPKCGADMLANKVGDKWCSLVGCDYSINAPEGDGNDA